MKRELERLELKSQEQRIFWGNGYSPLDYTASSVENYRTKQVLGMRQS